MYFAMADLWQTTHDTTLQQRCQADWNHTKSAFTLNELTTCGVGWQSTGCDDSAWDCYMYIEAYLVTGDSYALQCAQTLAGNMFSRWYDSALGGGMWYRDARDFKSLYQAPSIMDYIKLYEITGTKSYLTHALLCYTWVEKRELRSFDNLYWCDYNSAGPVGASTPYDIGQAGSVCFIGGEMTMAAVHARLYRDLGDDIYRVRALRTIAAIRNRYLDSHGVLINDRDAWADGSFVGEYAREALSLPGVNPTDVTALKNTATAIFNNDRTSTGYYGGCWDGPVGTSGDVWSNVGSTPQQIMTSANSINMICAAANLP
jgi:predicted alpha-1,6-mannanase (GH76 family)